MVPWIRGWGPEVEVLAPKHLRHRISLDVQRLMEIYENNLKNELIAHVREKDGEIQSLWEHLTGVSVFTGQFADKIGLKETGEILGLLHDLGKASQEFQIYIRSGEGLIDPDADEWIDYKAKKGKIDHSSAGAQILYRRLYERGKEGHITAQALSLCIASHHSGLIDCLTPSGENNFKRRIEKPEKKTHVNEAWSNINEIDKKLNKLLSQKFEDNFIRVLKNLKAAPESHETFSFKQGLLIRYLLSCLIDADRLDTADFDFPLNKRIRNYGQYHSWNTLIQRLDDKLEAFECKEDKNDIDKLRSQVSQECLEFSSKPRGVYQLTVPTGGGKTLSSLRFALNHAKLHNMDRVFYIIPYTSIIDQNADEVRKILEDKDYNGEYLDKVVLEHHSNLTPEEESYRQKLLADNWDAPIVFTTQVQFLETLFGSGTRSIRRMHQLANSIIIFDEVQTIPVRTVHMFNTALRFLVQSCGSTIILCTATQPLLDKVEPYTRALPIDGKIIQNEKELYKKLKRVKVFDKRKVGGWNDDEVSELAEQELQEKGSILIVVNTKKSARSLYQAITERSDTEAYHLSTNMCPAHRLEILEKIIAKLDANEPVICVSTQLIEAGVDIDFGSVIRYLAGLDSITQAAGRCNRNGKQKDFGNVWIVNPEREHIDRLPDIKVGVKIAERILGEFDVDPKAFDDNILGLDAMARYYKYYFYNRKDEMDYNVLKSSLIGREDNLFNLLSQNTIAERRRKKNTGSTSTLPFRQSFQSASRIFQAIDSSTRGVIVPYGEDGEEIINDLCSIFHLNKQYKLIRKAQRYSVNLYPHEFQHMVKNGAVREIQKGAGIYYLDYQYYSKEFGWSKEIVTEMKTQIV
jgi:CRISPR-associated endonuclease/helicase Cas3